jgi:hypothetical protein
VNLKSEIRRPKPETRKPRGTGAFFGFRISGFFRPSDFGLRISLGLALGLAVILSPLGARADGLVVRTKQTQGSFIVTIFTPLEVSRELPTDVMVMIQRRDSGEVVMNAAVDLSFLPPAGVKLSPKDVLCTSTHNLLSPELTAAPDQPASLRAPRAQAANKLFYGIPVVLRAVGNWQLRATIRQSGEAASVTCTLPVGMSPPPLRGLWPYLALPPIAITLFAMNQWLRRRAQAVRAGFERGSPGTTSLVTPGNASEGFTARNVSSFGQGRIVKYPSLVEQKDFENPPAQ